MDQPEPVTILAVFALVLAVLMALSAWGARKKAGRPNPASLAVWEEVAKRLGGKVFISEFGDFRVRFLWNGREAALFEEAHVIFRIDLCDFGNLRLHLEPRVTGDKMRFDLGAVDQAFVTPAVRKLLEDLADLGAREVGLDTRIRITGKPPRNAGDLVRFAVLCLQFAQHARLFAEKDDRVSVVESAATATGECQICGASLEGSLVRCARCSTPHHADCWEYAGRCSTYGCGERTFVA